MPTTTLRRMREKANLSLNSIALEAGIEPGRLSLIERGKRCNRQTADRIGAAMGVDPRRLFDDYHVLRNW